MRNLSYLHGKPSTTALYKAHNEDFIVQEDLGYDLDGEGEHVFIYVRKNGYNTQFIAEQLAKFAEIPAKLASYAGLKDRNAVTEQWFGLHMPGQQTPDFTKFNLNDCEILAVTRHRKKLKIGALKGNKFILTLREISDQQNIEQRLTEIKQHGVPNYFGEQRFGRDNHNIEQAILWANNEIKVNDRKKRGFYLSAARSAIFNDIVSTRIAENHHQTIMLGDALQLTGRGSWFVAIETELNESKNRLNAGELTITAPLVGDNDLGTKNDALLFEQTCINVKWSAFLPLFKRERLETMRRAILLKPSSLSWNWLNESTLQLNFALPSGCYATAVLREVINQSE